MINKKGQPGKTRSEQAVETRQCLLDTAKKLFATNGYTLTSVRSINRELSMSDGILYHYFPGGKKEILSVILREGLQRSFAVMSELNDELEDMPLREALNRIYWQGDRLFSDDPDLFQILLKESDNLELNETQLLSDVLLERTKWFTGFLARRYENGEIREMDFSIASQNFWASSLTNWIGKLLKIEFLRKLESDTDREKIIEHTLNLWRIP
ncbi:TetR/AcrR family transcriptional regulator [Paenibacillus sp. FSL R10-2736]|uniref:TetR/AcrR family transcriptional regulator n=1 Tax=Paenibacillus sp. FSL R10-2736 TaxID=2954692 RepID=UPI0030F9DE64